MQTFPIKDYAAITSPGNIISMSPGDGCIGMDEAGLLRGVSVRVRSAVMPFFQSLSPSYQQPPDTNDKSVSYDVGPAAQTGQSVLKDICQSTGFVAQLAGAWVPQVKLLADVVAKLSTYGSFGSKVIECLQDNNVINGQISAPKCTGDKPRSSTQSSVPAGVLTAATVVALSQMPIAAATPDRSKATNRPIPVPDRETLEQIGHNDTYPLSGHYVQTQDINSDVSIGSEDQPFYGHYDGGCHTISGQRSCLFGKLAEHGVVSNLRLAHAQVESDDKYSAVVACKMGEGSRVENLLIEHSSLLTNKDGLPSSLVPGTDPKTHAGLVTGHQRENSHIEQIGINNCSLTSTGQAASVGIISGVSEGYIRHITVNNSRAKTERDDSIAGIGAGVVKGRIDHLTVLNSQTETDEFDSIAGIGAGQISRGGSVKHLTTFNSSVETRQESSDAGIGAGRCHGMLEGATAIACNATALGKGSDVGIGVGDNNGEAFDIRAIYCLVNTTGQDANAAIGTGYFRGGRTENITVVNSIITTSGKDSRADIGAGKINSFLSSINHHSIKSMTDSVRGANVTVNGISQNIRNVSQATLDQLCDIADQRFVTNDCRVMNPPSTGLWNSKATAERGALICPDKTPTPPTITNQIIEVTNAATLGKIGTDPNYPLSATYIQTADLDASSLSQPISRFTGQYNGQHHTIANLGCCLVDTLAGGGAIGNLHFTGARINASRSAGVVACGVRGNGTIHDILVDNSQVMTTGNDADAGIGTGVLLGGLVVNTASINSTVATSGKGADAGIGAGSLASKGAVSNTTSRSSRVETTGNKANAAIGAGAVAGGAITNTTDTDSRVNTFGEGSNAAIGAGTMNNGATATGTIAVNSQVITSGNGANAGIGAGRMGRDTVARDTSAQNSQVSTSGDGASAGIGVGVMDHRARIAFTRSDNSKVVTSGAGANAGIGAGAVRGNATVDYTRAVNSTAIASGNGTRAGIGAGLVEAGGLVANTTQVNSFAGKTDYFSDTAGKPLPVTPAPVTETVATVAGTTMNFSGLPGAALPTSAAPLAGTLSTGAIAGITLGAAAFVLAGVAGVCIYRHYHRRPSPAGSQELEVVKTVIQGEGEEPDTEQRHKITPKPPGLENMALPEKPPVQPGDQFYEELREHVIPWHEHKYENVGRYEDAGLYEEIDTCKTVVRS